MAENVDLYDNAYANHALDLYREVRIETYGEDFGQTSWVSNPESKDIPRLLDLNKNSAVLEIGCGSGVYALHLAQTEGCSIIGLDVNSAGIRNANDVVVARGLESRARFGECDVSKGLPFEDGKFDAVFSNDVLCHIPGRLKLLVEIFRALKPGGRMLFSDALVIAGMVSHEEIATRSSIGFYVYAPLAENERLLELAGFSEITARDTTGNAVEIAKRWYQARADREVNLVKVEGENNFHGLQRFLSCVRTLTSERRLLRMLYTARKGATA